MGTHIHLLKVARSLPDDQRNEYFAQFIDDECRERGWSKENASFPSKPEISDGDVDIWRLSYEASEN